MASIICETASSSNGKFSSTLKIDALGRLMNNKGDTTADSYVVDTYKYDEKNNMIVHVNYETGIKLEPMTFKFKYDNHGRVIDRTLCSPHGYVYQRNTYELKAIDSKGNWIKAIVRFKDYMNSGSNTRTDTITRKITYY